MRSSRQFRPQAVAALEDRIAPSQVAPTAVKSTQKTAAPTFQLDIADTLAAGLPVAENRTIRYSTGAVQTESWQINPDLSNATTDTTKTINLPNNGGTEQVLDFSYGNGGNSTTDVMSNYRPDGSVATQTETDQVAGNVTQITGSISITGEGPVESYAGSSTVRGNTTITNKTLTLASGTVFERDVKVQHGELKMTETDTLTDPTSHTHQVTRFTTTIVRVQPSSPISLGNEAPGTVVAPPTLG